MSNKHATWLRDHASGFTSAPADSCRAAADEIDRLEAELARLSPSPRPARLCVECGRPLSASVPADHVMHDACVRVATFVAATDPRRDVWRMTRDGGEL